MGPLHVAEILVIKIFGKNNMPVLKGMYRPMFAVKQRPIIRGMFKGFPYKATRANRRSNRIFWIVYGGRIVKMGVGKIKHRMPENFIGNSRMLFEYRSKQRDCLRMASSV